MLRRGFPGANLIGQVLRQVSKPLSKAMVKRLKKRPFLKKYVLTQLGRFYHWCDDKLDRPLVPVTKRKPVDDVRTMEFGAKLLIEVKIAADRDVT